MIRVLFCGLKYEYGNPALGLSFEYQNFYETLRRMEGIEADMFAMDEIMLEAGRDEMNRQLIRTVEAEQPDLLFCFLFTEEIKKETIGYITLHTKTKTFNWFADDHWRFHIFSKNWAPLFTAVGTTDSEAVGKYNRLGIRQAIHTQWAANTFLYRPQQPAKNNGEYGITFVGKKYGNRGSYLALLQKHNLPAAGFGKGWGSGVLSEQKKLEIFSYSKINLNFTESYLEWPKEMVKMLISKELGRYRINTRPVESLRALRGKRQAQIKARIFEVPACGGFLMTGDADNLRDYYQEGREIVIFNNRDDLVEKCRYYLEHDELRREIAKAGYERTLREHTYEKRFLEIFKALGLNT